MTSHPISLSDALWRSRDIACPRPTILSPPKVLYQLIGDPTDVRPRVVEHLKGRDLQEQEPAEDSGYRRCIPREVDH